MSRQELLTQANVAALEGKIESLKYMFKNNILQMSLLKVNKKNVFYEVSKISLYQNNRLPGRLKAFMILREQKMKELIKMPDRMFIVFLQDEDQNLKILYIKGSELIKKLNKIEVQFKF